MLFKFAELQAALITLCLSARSNLRNQLTIKFIPPQPKKSATLCLRTTL